MTGRSATYFELTRNRFVDSRMIREHGNSYLAIAEWSGLLGVIPFYLLVGDGNSSGEKSHRATAAHGRYFCSRGPAAAILIAGLIDAGFEDWLFAAGYYLAVFFWAMSFILADLVHSSSALGDAEIVSATPQFAAPVMMPVAGRHFDDSYFLKRASGQRRRGFDVFE